jgi:hypothetical protein
MKFVLIFLFFFLILVSFGCGDNKCKNVGDLRCDENVLQICNSDKEWEDYNACYEYGQICTEECGYYMACCA